jgi:hypothetical protein
VPDGGAERQQDASQIDGEDAMPLVEVELGDCGPVRERAGVGEGDTQRSKLSDEFIDRRRQRRGIGHVGSSRPGVSTQRSHLTDQPVQTHSVETDRRDVRTFSGGT